jgi:hypothetical protein
VYGDPVDWSFKGYKACNLISKLNLSVILGAQRPHAAADIRHGTRKVCGNVTLPNMPRGIKTEHPTQFLPITPPKFFPLFYFELIFFFLIELNETIEPGFYNESEILWLRNWQPSRSGYL